jgi:hypothetical protein
MKIMTIHLRPWEDVVGPLHEIHVLDGYLEAKIGPVLVSLPFELKEKLERLVGKQVGLLRTEEDYRIKVE